MLELKNIKKEYRTASETVHALKGVSITFRDKEFVSVLGPSGCGKTTLLNIIGGLDKYTSGKLIINGKSTRHFKNRDWDVYRNHRIGFIFQSYNLIPHQTILGNVELALTISGIPRKERVRRAKEALDRVGLSGQYYKRPNQLSGGQCQRVAIARALVNNPEILLADEPTGALDSVTSVQIMNLIKEISRERLVIMVTHNPELAEAYSTRIVRFVDGRIVEDTNPVRTVEHRDGRAPAKSSSQKRGRREKARMSVFTAFRLSARNLISKKGRTSMVGIAGSIGIIGIALVLAFSSGIKGYVASMQDDMLSGNPISITETTYDLNALTDMMNAGDKVDIIKQPNKVYVSSVIEYLISTSRDFESLVIENDISEEYIDYVKAMPKDYYNALLFDYGIDMSASVFTDFKTEKDGDSQHISIKRLTDMYTSILGETDFKEYASFVTMLAPSLKQAPNSNEYLLSQYDLVGGGKIAESAGEIMLVLNENDELSDLLLARLGYYSEDEFLEIVYKATNEDGEYDESLYREYFDYDELIGKTLTWYPADTVFTESAYAVPGMPSYQYNSTFEEAGEDGLTLTVVGILTPKDEISYGSLTSGIYYTEALTEHVLSENSESKFIDYLVSEEAYETLSRMYFNIPYSYSYNYEGETKTVMGAVGPTMQLSDAMGGIGGAGGTTIDADSMRDRFVRNLGGNDVANDISIYPISFDDKNLITEYLDKWNEEGVITVNGTKLSADERQDVTYSDTLELIINLINTMIDVVSAALIAFTSISLVVSTVMIGIITYVSVVERIKEIGVIRSLGGRRRDVSNLFIAETVIIGLLSGIIGVGATYGISAIANVIVHSLIGIKTIAYLPPSNAVLLIVLSVALTLISGLSPASSAARKDPVVALRTE